MPLRSNPIFFIAPLIISLAGCTAVLPPDEGDDNVERCENSDDCTASTDNRYVASCVTDFNEIDGAPGVCVYDYVEVSCDPDDWLPEKAPWADVARAAAENTGAYLGCDPEKLGKRGCGERADGEPCDAGLVVDYSDGPGVCLDPDAMPAILRASYDRAGQEVQHAFCRAYFGCDDAFVCNLNLGKCVPCDPTKDADNGGCVEMWVNGELATAYEDLSCNNKGDIEEENIQVGVPNVGPVSD